MNKSVVTTLLSRTKNRLFRRIPWQIGLGAIFFVSLLALAACSSSQSSVSPTAVTSAPAPTTTSTRSTYPMTVTDILGRSVVLNQKPVRIVTTQPTATEMLYKIGGTAIGRDSSSKYPDEAQSLPTVGSSYSISMEAVAGLNPDLLIIEALTQSRLLGDFEKLGVPVLVVRAASLDDIVQGLTLVGKVVDLNSNASQSINEIKSRIEAAKKTTRAGRNILILISDANRNIYAAKPESYPGTLAALLGQGNLASGLAESGPYPGFALYTGEKALIDSPDAIFTISPAPPPAPKLSDMLAQVPGFNQMNVVKAGKVKELDPTLFLQATGPRIADAVEQLAALLNQVAP